MLRPDTIALLGATPGLYESGVLKQPDAANPDQPEPFLPLLDLQKYRPLTQRALVTASFKTKTLAEIIDEITDATGANVILTPQAADKSKQPLTVRFANTPVDAAVRTLCEMTDLGVIEDANVLIVTTAERAAAKTKADADKRKVRQADAALVGLGGLGGAAPFGDFSAELARLREQNEELKKQLEEIRKLLKK